MYSSWMGVITFKNKDDKLRAIKLFEESGKLSEDFKDFDSLEIDLEEIITTNDGNRGIHRIIEELRSIPFSGEMIGSTHDCGVVEGYILNNDKDETVDLIEFGKAKNIQLPDDTDHPDYFDKANEIIEMWLDEVL